MDALKTRRWWALGALTLAVLAVGLDGTVLSVALPTLATDLHASTADLQWFVSGYTLVLAAALLPAGLLGDRHGRKKVLLGVLALFGVAQRHPHRADRGGLRADRGRPTRLGRPHRAGRHGRRQANQTGEQLQRYLKQIDRACGKALFQLRRSW